MMACFTRSYFISLVLAYLICKLEFNKDKLTFKKLFPNTIRNKFISISQTLLICYLTNNTKNYIDYTNL